MWISGEPDISAIASEILKKNGQINKFLCLKI
jgi:hypothetical protein